jgi:hypothetical protein
VDSGATWLVAGYAPEAAQHERLFSAQMTTAVRQATERTHASATRQSLLHWMRAQPR